VIVSQLYTDRHTETIVWTASSFQWTEDSMHYCNVCWKIPYVTNQCFGVVCVQPVTSAGLAKNGQFLSYDSLVMIVESRW